MIDIDCFKQYNDHFGHQMGDQCLKQVVKSVSRALKRPGDLLARYGGEEFSVVLPDTSSQGAAFVAEGIRKAIEALKLPHPHSKVANVVTVSVGVCTIVPGRSDSLESFRKAADEALYRAKSEGRNRIFRQEIVPTRSAA